MKRISYILFLFIALTSCSQKAEYGKPKVNPKEVQQKFMKWWTYYYDEILLSSDFNALDENSKPISKEAFLTKLTDGKFIPIELESTNNMTFYKLFAIESTSDSSIKATIVERAFSELQNYKKEGKQFPTFSFKDLNGNLITNATMKGKVIVIKCWFIHCVACIEEFPQVNALANRYKNRTAVQFISFAEDAPEQLNAFLTKKPLNYTTVPNLKVYMNEVLQINGFPTHFIIDKEGKIVKVTSSLKSLEVALEEELK